MTATYPIGQFGPPRPCPEIATDRLVLGPQTAEDWPDFLAIMASDRAKYMGGPYSVADAWGVFCADIAGWGLTGAGGLAIRKDCRTIGQISLNDKPSFPEPELGWLLYEGHDGHGYATEAAEAVRDWVRETQRPATLVSYTHRDNAASIAVATRLGAIRDPDATCLAGNDFVFRHWGAA